ncbi:unnamed protein product [Paramecium sonneborni]|uniref:Uncharacterized protein n=1 Tax=Paramecium sonneborni TaxID=65129 RepID=A0A8S1NR08_9CILI|nr:unnamed protein product [Paramecium sonneborni]
MNDNKRENQLMFKNLTLLVIINVSNTLVDYFRNSIFALGLLLIQIHKQYKNKQDNFNNQYLSTTKSQSPRQIDNQGFMLIDKKNLNCIYMNEYIRRKLNNNSLKVKKVDFSSKSQLDLKLKNIDLFELLSQFKLKKMTSIRILDCDILPDHIIQINQEENTDFINITFQDSKERDDYLKRQYLYQIMKQLFTTISHEFGTLLNFILAIAQVAIDKYPSQQYYYSIKNTCEIMHNFILDMVDYNDILGRKFKLQLEQLDICTILESVITLFQEQCRQKQLQLEYQNHIPDGWQIISDQRRIKQILIHLICNAQKFTINGSIIISAIQINEENIQFSVSDTGIGMSKDDEQNLREMLKQDFKSEHHISANTAGFGLGCYLANKLCLHLSNQQSGLQFKINEVGTTFWFMVANNILPTSSLNGLGIQKINKYSYIDLKQTQIDKNAGRRLSRMGSRVSQNSMPKVLSYKGLIDPIKENTESLINEEVNSIERKTRTTTLNRNIKQTLKFLIVDDEMINILGLSLILKRMNIDSDYVFNGIECLKQMEQNKYAYQGIFMDINMPLMNGYETSKNLISLYGNQIKIIACTAYTDSDTKQRCYDIGMSYFLNKPVNVIELQKILIQFQQ